ncbi:gp121 [Bacillus phage W.Ph.]|uniref:Gp121 n=1 Tax=Bacillus phage W.Ph. TaxID=764595 RepID=G9B1M2_9CAUD|nr:gp121 [Bacillus phage W.Ph.]ADH03267.1 gp121 [Bacillus phage W.Ph.]
MSSEKRTTFTNNFEWGVLGIPDNTATIALVKKDIKHMRNAIIDAARRSYWNSVVHYGTLVQQKEEELMYLERQQDDYNILIGAKL